MEPQTSFADVGRGITLAYETFGNPSDRPIVLIMGLGTQMIAWPDEFCRALASQGRYVIRYDNRDIGLSTHLDSLPTPNPALVLTRIGKAPYSIADMTLDALGLLDQLQLAEVDVVGASMGGFIAQTLILHAPERVRSLSLIMTSTGSALVGRPKPSSLRALVFRPQAANEEEVLDLVVATFRRIGSPGFPFEEEFIREMTRRSMARSYDQAGLLRQLAAVLSQPDRTRALRGIRSPTLVVHGLADPLVAPSGGMAIAKAIAGSRFIGYAGMGHDLPRGLWQPIAAEIGRTAA